ncbi:hypothetical protein DEALK_06790 [Dehalogenimonas alkenigignens]|uniref:Uncharacterized protein n=1 Tax=Dehalogenimonas alkenigignens TaxID=1217799 RepID=A0A0W0GGZ2_9CHLR|nr:hypothetical protein [Dehalogenimonas alkenigignens]KTB47834.1 hypothetical protein DEALK_06790 [Dehalogenimonas alkenigignens]
MVLDIVFAPMALSPTTFNAGDTVRVTVSFKYVVGVTKTVKLLAGPYSTNLFGKHMVDACVGQADLSLPASSTPAGGTGSVDFLLVPKRSGGIDDGTFGLRVWIEDTNAVAEQDAVIIVAGNSSGGDMLSGMMPMLMMLLMMGMILSMTQNLGEESG